MMRRILIGLIVLFAAVDLVLAGYYLFVSPNSPLDSTTQSQPAATSSPAPEATPEPQPVVETVRFSATGDNLIHDGIYLQAARRAEDGGYDFSLCYENMTDFYSQFDLNWLNQETLITQTIPPSGYPCFATPDEIFPYLYDTGFRAFSISNNHTYDQGAAGLRETAEFWSSVPEDVAVSGLYDRQQPDNYTYQTVNGITFGYLSYTEHTNGLPTPGDAEVSVIYTDERELIQAQMEAVRPNCDVLVVSCHWGTEGSHSINDSQRELAQQLSDWGADLIIGTHPHVVQNAEYLTGADGNETFVVYSLGNFLNYQAAADNMIGTILDITFQKITQPDGTVSVTMEQPLLHPVVMHYDSGYQNGRVYLYADYTPELAAQHGVRSYDHFDYEYVRQVIEENISPEFIAW